MPALSVRSYNSDWNSPDCISDRIHRRLTHNARAVDLFSCRAPSRSLLASRWILCARRQTHVKIILAHSVPGKLFGEFYGLAALFHLLLAVPKQRYHFFGDLAVIIRIDK